MSFETHWTRLTQGLTSFTPTDKSLARLFYDFGRYDIGEAVQKALQDTNDTAILTPPKIIPTEGVIDERTS